MSNSDASDKVNRSFWLQRLEGLKYFVLVTGQSHLHLSTRGKRCAAEQRHVKKLKQYFFPHSARVMSPTVFSTFCLVFIRHTTFTASCWACKRVGMKSPLRIHSLLSTLQLGERGTRKNGRGSTRSTPTLEAPLTTPW